MKYFNTLIFIGILGVLLPSCRTSAGQSSGDSIVSIAKKHLNSDTVERKDNTSKSYSLFYFNDKYITKYIVIRISDSKVVYEGSVRGTVYWVSDTEIKQFAVPEIVRPNEDISRFVKVIDVTNINLDH